MAKSDFYKRADDRLTRASLSLSLCVCVCVCSKCRLSCRVLMTRHATVPSFGHYTGNSHSGSPVETTLVVCLFYFGPLI